MRKFKNTPRVFKMVRSDGTKFIEVIYHNRSEYYEFKSAYVYEKGHSMYDEISMMEGNSGKEICYVNEEQIKKQLGIK